MIDVLTDHARSARLEEFSSEMLREVGAVPSGTMAHL